ncbi:triose-phosphate isomerase [Neptunomonas sp.]|uniref:triose-phosphate isomerase n=1 Tax=Neptunomonas TaxID=75687 RepID=UPI003514A1D5
MPKMYVIGNWKMHGSKITNCRLIEGILSKLPILTKVDVAICPPFPYLQQTSDKLFRRPILLGAQDLSCAKEGAYTGEVSGDMLRDLKTRFVLVGHSERRAIHNESDQVVANKFAAALEADLIPVLCVGETLEQREAGHAEQVIAEQVSAVINAVGVEALSKGIIAYEPVWAIGSGKTATPLQAQHIHAFIRGLVREHNETIGSDLSILYGGSVNPDNAATLFGQPDINGGLIGGASLKADSFVSICLAANM